MSHKVYFFREFYDKFVLKTVPKEGLLYGVSDGSVLIVVGTCYNDVEKAISAEEGLSMLPYGMEKIGYTVIYDGNMLKSPLTDKANGYLLTRDINTEGLHLKKGSKKALSPIEYSLIDDMECRKLLLNMRIRAEFNLSFFDAATFKESMADLKQKVSSSKNIALRYENDDITLTEQVVSKSKTIDNLCTGHGCSSVSEQIPLKFNILPPLSHEDNLNSRCSVHCSITSKNTKIKKFTCHILVDSLCLCWRKAPESQLFNLAKNSVVHFLSLYSLTMSKNGVSTDSSFKAQHFEPTGLGHSVTVLYDTQAGEDVNVKQREKLHMLFDLPLNQPFFRSTFTNSKLSNLKYPAMNVHLNIPKSGVSGGQPVVIAGNYIYYHYNMQDEFNDSGWGCAYRSLQTIYSWFMLHGYTDSPVPDHKAIQECLVKLKDKPKSFIGSHQWIGSSEIAFCLSDMVGVECEILHLSSREELIEYGSKLEAHFKINDIPVMIGGGQLAHTIIGVHFNKEDGDIKFLVLDPHYMGKDEIKNIQMKGGVAWRPISFWEKNAFYNLCLPKKPKVAY